MLKRTYTYKAFIRSLLSPCDLQIVHFTPSILLVTVLIILAVCLEQCYCIRIYRLCGVVWCGVVELNLLSATTVHNDFLCSKIPRDTNYALSLRQYINQLSHHNGSRDIIAILSERILLNDNVRERTFRLCIHIVH